MKTNIQRWGNSLAVRIPRAFAAETNISDGTQVELSVKGSALVLRPVLRKRIALGDLLGSIKASNRHDEVPSGRAVGAEAW